MYNTFKGSRRSVLSIEIYGKERVDLVRTNHSFAISRGVKMDDFCGFRLIKTSDGDK